EWLKFYYENFHRWTHFPGQFSTLHIAARWGIAPLVDYLFPRKVSMSCTGDTSIERIFTSDYHDADFPTEEGVTPLEEAAASGQIAVMGLLLDHGDRKMSSRVVTVAAGNGRNGNEAMELLLNSCGDQIVIAEEVVQAAAGNEGNGKEVMALLLNKRG